MRNYYEPREVAACERKAAEAAQVHGNNYLKEMANVLNKAQTDMNKRVKQSIAAALIFFLLCSLLILCFTIFAPSNLNT